MHHRLLLAALFAGCTATVATAPPPQNPQPPPPPPPQPTQPQPTPVVVVQQPTPPPVAPASHPAYLHALSDLRAARGFLARPAKAVVKYDEKRAIREIDAAIAEIRQASVDDGKPLEDHPPVDAGLVWGNRLQKAYELVETARRDVNQEEDNAWANGLKNRALGHIDLAARDIEAGIRDEGMVVKAPPPPPPMPPPPPPPPVVAKHPAYLHALTDLRAARGYLERPGNIVVKWDEKHAIREIDGAIGEIKGASIDDGKPLEDHPPLDVPTWGGRLQRSLELLGKARADVNEEEDNPQSRKLRNAALHRIDAAEKFVREGIEDAKKIKEMTPPPPPPPPPGAHPAYTAALGNLRRARALLERPAASDVKWDEQNGIREIDAALTEIRNAKMDDGIAATEHTPIDAKIVYRDRLREAMKLLGDAAKDIEGREDNAWAKPQRRAALDHIRNAEHAVREAAEDRHEDKKHGKK
jgi:hypothetical protein